MFESILLIPAGLQAAALDVTVSGASLASVTSNTLAGNARCALLNLVSLCCALICIILGKFTQQFGS
jgi:hypothetical protein